jgi:hypothetical protein
MPIGPILALSAIGVIEAFAAIEATEAIEAIEAIGAIADNDPRGATQRRVGASDPRGASTWTDGGRWSRRAHSGGASREMRHTRARGKGGGWAEGYAVLWEEGREGILRKEEGGRTRDEGGRRDSLRRKWKSVWGVPSRSEEVTILDRTARARSERTFVIAQLSQKSGLF